MQYLFDDCKDYKVVSLLSTDGDGMHAVTIWKRIIFDSSLERALPLSLASLDFIVGEGCYFKGINHGYRINIENRPHFKTKNLRRHKKIQRKRQLSIKEESESENENKKQIKKTKLNFETMPISAPLNNDHRDSSTEDEGVL